MWVSWPATCSGTHHCIWTKGLTIHRTRVTMKRLDLLCNKPQCISPHCCDEIFPSPLSLALVCFWAGRVRGDTHITMLGLVWAFTILLGWLCTCHAKWNLFPLSLFCPAFSLTVSGMCCLSMGNMILILFFLFSTKFNSLEFFLQLDWKVGGFAVLSVCLIGGLQF